MHSQVHLFAAPQTTAHQAPLSMARLLEGFPELTVKNPPANAGDVRDSGSIPGLGRSLGGGRGNQQDSPVFLPGESHGQRSLVGYI